MRGYRGKLIHPFLVRIAPLDIATTAADPDGAGPLQSGYDKYTKEPVRAPNGTQRGAPGRKEKEPVDLLAQVEDAAWEALTMMRTGNSARTELTIVIHFPELEARGFVSSTTGAALVPKVGDRLVSIHDTQGNLIQEVPNPPGLYCMQPQPRGYGLGGARNLLVCTFEDRATSTRS